jgi:hypothetical protein
VGWVGSQDTHSSHFGGESLDERRQFSGTLFNPSTQGVQGLVVTQGRYKSAKEIALKLSLGLLKVSRTGRMSGINERNLTSSRPEYCI